jgi:hypothetical protein
MRSYLELKKPEEARQAFEFCKRRLGIRLKRKPSAATVALFETTAEHEGTGEDSGSN